MPSGASPGEREPARGRTRELARLGACPASGALGVTLNFYLSTSLLKGPLGLRRYIPGKEKRMDVPLAPKPRRCLWTPSKPPATNWGWTQRGLWLVAC